MSNASQVVAIDEALRRAICDEYGELDRQVTAFAPVAKRHAALQQTIRGYAIDLAADINAIYTGDLYQILVSERGEERYLDPKAKRVIFKILKTVRAMELFTITLKAAEDELGKEELEALVTRARTGSRKLVAVAIAPAESARKAA